ncbi:MBL fold metallo-hydrolase [Corynebacterium mendelii]|uniref:MBL fold metallo-hydrolase n=1 Tax=Corynebacterium mendelii TaxID=2765362 RepID=A0A939IX59_9CORY|nr:MBL fold metallo-hydrolase [Corynebacterium mendelii]MBN9644135.1 MBL fold metallo-hydrolase [Corynebacterium mendelii]
MKLDILGCSGSLAAPGNPASGYLLHSAGHRPVIMDFGPGCLAALQQVADPSTAHVVFSHLHADHCMDFPSLLVWRRYHPQQPATARNTLIAPGFAPDRLGRLSADEPDGVDDFSDTFDFSPWIPAVSQRVGGLTITPRPAVHPTEAYCLRVEEQSTGKVLAYSGDTDYTRNCVAAARGADVFLCEATWGASSEGKVADMHVSGREAGIMAREAGVKHLLLVHIPPWVDPGEAKTAAEKQFPGPVTLAVPGMSLTV